MIAEDGLPISLVEGKGFISLVKYIEPDYTLPTRKTFVNILDKMMSDKKGKVKQDLHKSAAIALTTDCWTSHAQEGYMTVTAHGLIDWKKASFVLETTPVQHLAGEEEEDEGAARLPQRHTALALQAQLNRVAVEWEVDAKISAVVHDNAANVRAIGQAVQAPDIGCTAHTLQLCVNAGLDSTQTMKTCIGAVSRLVGHFRHSVVATQALSAKQDQHNLPKHKLIQSVKTRCNSVYDMFSRVKEQRWAITSVLGDERVTPRRNAATFEIKDEH
ncbi:uncharacterized protein LOC121430255 [Lytechinus variegatus]|uniref:uncharacterized protein LOC121430255 n=1 Tax=Lytechinus variegatus TaxID=7654 RepID=UPI001BB197D9|nr:uncharacterized protein LOC121430255 [Lytechinus variegatus]